MKTLRILTALMAVILPFQASAVTLKKANHMDCSYWLHASLANDTWRNYWSPEAPAPTAPTRNEIKNAGKLLCGEYGANRLYLIYHKEIPVSDALRVFRWWRESCPKTVEIVPTLLLTMYDKAMTPVFTAEEMKALAPALKKALRAQHSAVYDVYPDRPQGEALPVLAKEFPEGLIRVGLQPGEKLKAPFVAAVEDTWSALCHGKTTEDWESPGFGRETLVKWVKERNGGPRIDWDLIVVAWDYLPTKRGEFPGYDDAEKNMPLPPARNRLAVETIRAAAKPESLAGFSSDLFILQANSLSKPHDGPENGFYATLKRGERYTGYYAAPFAEVVALYRELQKAGN